MKLQIEVDDKGIITDAKVKHLDVVLQCSVVHHYWLKGAHIDNAQSIKNTEIATELALPQLRYIVQFLLKMSSLQSKIINESAVVMISGSYCLIVDTIRIVEQLCDDIDRRGNVIQFVNIVDEMPRQRLKGQTHRIF